MQPRINVITLAVDDLERSLRFYRDGLGLQSSGIRGTEFEGDEKHASGALVMCELAGGLILALYPRTELAKDAAVSYAPAKTGEFSVGQLVASKDQVDAVLAAAALAGATITEPARERPWGIYSGYFRDPDGHLWEIIWNPERT